jgi:hypothetical protein
VTTAPEGVPSAGASICLVSDILHRAMQPAALNAMRQVCDTCGAWCGGSFRANSYGLSGEGALGELFTRLIYIGLRAIAQLSQPISSSDVRLTPCLVMGL